MARQGPRRKLRETLLVVGEGDAEVAFLRQVKSLYTCGGQGRSVTIRNAAGKGALHVITYAARLRGLAEYTESAAIFDSDTDWNQDTAALARRSRITVLVSEPCLERSLLAISGQRINGDSAACKRVFEQKFGGPAHQHGLIEANFPLQLLNSAREEVEVLDRLLCTMGV